MIYVTRCQSGKTNRHMKPSQPGTADEFMAVSVHDRQMTRIWKGEVRTLSNKFTLNNDRNAHTRAAVMTRSQAG